MPSRFITLAIVVFWLATCGWLLYRDVLPWLQAGEAPRLFHADFSDEVRRSEVRWFVYRDRKQLGAPVAKEDRVGSGTSVTVRNVDRSYSLSTQLDFNGLEIGLPHLGGKGLSVKLRKIISNYVVGPKEDLRALACEATLDAMAPWTGIIVATEGRVIEGAMVSQFRVRGLPKPIDERLEPVKVSAHASFVNPMHLLPRVPDRLHEGQSWPVPLVDPLGDAVMGFVAKSFPLVKMISPVLNVRIEKLFARVASGTYESGGMREDCWVIDYRRDPGKPAIFARTWVRKSDQWILCQEASFHGSRLVIARVIVSSGPPR